MKFSLPGFKRSSSGESDAGEGDKLQRGAVADDDASAIKPASLARARAQFIAAAVVLIVLLALFVFQLMSV